MAADSSTLAQPQKPTKKRPRKSQLRVVFDSNSLYVTTNSTGSASDLVRQEIVALISDSKYPDLDIAWYLPEIVRHERQYQMRSEALKLRPAINRIERLLDHSLALSDETLLDHVDRKIEQKEKQLGLQEIKLDAAAVDWSKLTRAAVYREAPFEAGEKEKGFRDAIAAESFLQLLASSPRTPELCRVVFITADARLTQAVKERTLASPNSSVLANVEELKGLINTIVSNVGEDFIAIIKPKAAKLYFISADQKETLFFKENIQDQVKEKFRAELKEMPPGTGFRENSTWYIEEPNFSKKEGRRVFWTSRIEVKFEAGNLVPSAQPPASQKSTIETQESTPLSIAAYTNIYRSYQPWLVSENLPWLPQGHMQISQPPEKKIVTHAGRDIYEVGWSTEVTMSKDLKKPIVEDIRHVELNCQPIS